MTEKSIQNTSTIGKKLWDARTEHKMSLRELAKASEISASMLSQIETGKAFPSVRSLYKIAGALDVSLDYFFPAQEDLQTQPDPELVTARNLTASEMREAIVGNGPENDGLGFVAQDFSAPIVRPETRPTIELNSGIRWARLTAQPETETEFLEITYAPEAKSGNTMSSHDGREFGLVLEGELMVELGFESHTLHMGDSIIFDSATPHRLSNPGQKVMRALWVVLNPKQL